ncbi:hypothetical protein BAY61_00860 [Prauserella marina]|uniref:4-amino-4-deoxy-L-arabinose transferase n=1 Tax=Prauserella marina TaxID=530584 RepID=A0A222VJ42_9PSEU|nr:hypothetical protein BAY61_00860 [Prauserella marina]PWV82348.1 4-amino-4-deoxy-L-arabinose transferase-like glycosyltransferase [Prauserella marina]SDC67003.1 4-amino-4-deoxy-L-arabinose transferase [Prauserella marina]
MTTTAEAGKQEMPENAEEPQPEQRQRRRASFMARRDGIAWLIGALALVAGGVFVGINLAYNQGNLMAPLDDVYIHLQYGKQLGSGHPFQYNTGDPISTGASSLLYAFVLGFAYLIGFTGSAFLWFAVLFGIGCFAIAAGLVYHLGRTLVSKSVGVWSGVLVALSGPLLWGAASGMEVGLTALLVVATVLAFTTERPTARFVRTPVLAFLLALVRPEGLFFALMLSGAMLWTIRGARKAQGKPVLAKPGTSLLCLLPLAAAIAQYLFYKLATGTFTANGVQSKSFLNDRPLFYFGDFVDRTTANVRGVIGFFNGMTGQDYAFPGAVVFFVLGLAYLIVTRPQWRALALAVGLGFGAVIVSASTLSTALIHELRYFHPFIPLFVLFIVCGVYAVSRLAPKERLRATGLHALLVVVLIFTLVAVPTWGIRYGREAATIRDTDVSVGAWISGNLPPDSVVAVKDVGAIAYFGDRKVVDTVGLATNGLAEPSNNGTGSLYEALRQLPEADRPDYFAVYEPVPGAPMQPLVAAGVLADPIAVFPVRAQLDLTGRRIVPFDSIQVYPADWRLAGSGDRSPVGGDVRDYLNVGDLRSEESHDYLPEMSQPGLQPDSLLRRQGDVIDSGRAIVGGERFTARNLRPGTPLTIATRVLTPGMERKVRVVVDGKDVGTWDFGPRRDQWTEETFTVPGEAITSPDVTVELKPERPLLSPYPEYTSFGYWFIQ